MKNKNGMLLASETLKMILALIGIGFLVYLLAAIYFSSEDTKNLAHADASIDYIKKVLENIGQDPSFVGEMYGVNPHAWSLFGFVNGLKPNQCVGQSCLCFCDHVREDYGVYIWEDRQESECSEDGLCLIVGNLKWSGEIELGTASEPVNIKIFENSGFIEVEKI